eukprot:2691407-Prorocentrum_lima.AAC.1
MTTLSGRGHMLPSSLHSASRRVPREIRLRRARVASRQPGTERASMDSRVSWPYQEEHRSARR